MNTPKLTKEEGKDYVKKVYIEIEKLKLITQTIHHSNYFVKPEDQEKIILEIYKKLEK